jgi:hypothetical protein
MKGSIGIAMLLVLILSTCALAGANMTAKGTVHLLPHASRDCAEGYPEIGGCGDIITTELSSDVDAFPVFYDLVEYVEFDYSLEWPGNASCLFTSCSDYTYGMIVWPGDGIAQRWATCQPGPVVVTGWGWIQDVGFICVRNHPTLGGVVIDCAGQQDYISGCVCAATGGYIGDDPCMPCDPVVNRSATLGSIKAQFEYGPPAQSPILP